MKKSKPKKPMPGIDHRRVAQADQYKYYLLKEGAGRKEHWRVYRKSDGLVLAIFYTESLRILFQFGGLEPVDAESPAHGLLLVKRAEEEYFKIGRCAE